MDALEQSIRNLGCDSGPLDREQVVYMLVGLYERIQKLEWLKEESDASVRRYEPGSWKWNTPPAAQRTWVGLTDEEKRSVCRVGPVYAPDGVVTRNPLECRKELEGVALMAVRQAEAKLKEKNT